MNVKDLFPLALQSLQDTVLRKPWKVARKLVDRRFIRKTKVVCVKLCGQDCFRLDASREPPEFLELRLGSWAAEGPLDHA